jgi:hypothetical protein
MSFIDKGVQNNEGKGSNESVSVDACLRGRNQGKFRQLEGRQWNLHGFWVKGENLLVTEGSASLLLLTPLEDQGQINTVWSGPTCPGNAGADGMSGSAANR